MVSTVSNTASLKFYNDMIRKIKLAQYDGTPIEAIRFQQTDATVDCVIKIIKEALVIPFPISSSSSSTSTSKDSTTTTATTSSTSKDTSTSGSLISPTNSFGTTSSNITGIKTLIIRGYRSNGRIFVKHQCDKLVHVIADQLILFNKKCQKQQHLDAIQNHQQIQEIYFEKCDISRSGILSLTLAMRYYGTAVAAAAAANDNNSNKKRRKARSRTSSGGSGSTGFFFTPTAVGRTFSSTSSTSTTTCATTTTTTASSSSVDDEPHYQSSSESVSHKWNINTTPSFNASESLQSLCPLRVLSFENVRGLNDDNSFCSNLIASAIKDEYCTLQELRIKSTPLGPSLLKSNITPASIIALNDMNESNHCPASGTTNTASIPGNCTNNPTTSTIVGTAGRIVSCIPTSGTINPASVAGIAGITGSTSNKVRVRIPWVRDISLAIQCNTSLKRLILEGLQMDDNDCLVIIHAVTKNTSISELSLASNIISDISAIAIAESIIIPSNRDNVSASGSRLPVGEEQSTSSTNPSRLQQYPNYRTSPVTKLQLQNNNIRNTGTIAIANALQYNTTIQYINLLNNKNITIDGGGIQAMTQMLHTNNTIRTIGLDQWHTNRIATKCLIEALHYNDTVTTLLDRSAGGNGTGTGTGINSSIVPTPPPNRHPFLFNRQLSIRTAFFLSSTINSTEDEKKLIANILVANRSGNREAPAKRQRRRTMYDFVSTVWIQQR